MQKMIAGASALLVLVGLYAASRYNYLLFHSLAEVFSIVIACGIFMVAWNTRRYVANHYLLIIGIAYLFVGVLDFVHTLSFAGMNVFPGYSANVPTQLWIAARYMESLTLLAAPIWLQRRIRPALGFLAYGIAVSAVLLSVFYWQVFPDCFLPEAGGLTPFKKASEYIICLILLASGAIAFRLRDRFDTGFLKWLLMSIAATVLAELAFTTYASVFGFSNLLGHYLKIVSFALLYKAVIETGLAKPYDLLFRDLARQREWLRVTLESIGDAVIATDTHGRITFLNKVAEALTGWSMAEGAGQPVQEVFRIVHEHTRAVAENPVQKVLQRGTIVGLANHTVLLRRGGGEVPIDDSGAPIRDEEGRILGVVLVFRDITARRQADEALQESAERLRLMGDNLPDSAVYQYAHEADGKIRFLYCSAGIERLNGVSIQDVLQNPAVLHRQILPEYYPRLVEAEASSARKLSDFDMEVPMLRPDGQVRWMRLHSRPRRMPDGRVLWDGVQTDVTDRKQAEEALRESEQRLRLALDAAYLISFEWDIQRNEVRRFVSTDPALGPTPEETPSTLEAVREVVHPEDRELFSANLLAALEQPDARYESEFRIVHPDGQVRWLHESGTVDRDTQGRPSRLIGLSQDITERKRVEQALRESEQCVRRKLDCVLSPEGDLGVLELSDLIDTPDIQKLMDDFYTVAHIPMSILDIKGQVLVGVGWQDICTRFHRVHPVTSRHCLESDTHLSTGLAQGEYRLYKCRNSLWDMATPIVVAGQHVGHIFTGQFFFEDETVDRERFRDQARQYGFDEEQYLAALDRVPRLSRDTVDRGMAFFLKLADMLSELGHSNVKLARLLAERDRLTDSLRQSRDTLEAVVENLDVGVMIADATGAILSMNSAALKMHGFASTADMFTQQEQFFQTFEMRHLDGRPVPAEERPALRSLRGDYFTALEMEVQDRRTQRRWIGSWSVAPVRSSNNEVRLLVFTVRDITAQKQAQKALQTSNARLELLATLAERLLRAHDPQMIVEELCHLVMAHIDCQFFFNYLVDVPGQRMKLNACAGIPAEAADDIRHLDFGVAVCGCVARDAQRIIAEDIQHSDDLRSQLVKSFGVQAYCCHPLLVEGRLIGTLSFGTRTRPTFTAAEVALMKTVTDKVAVAMQRLQASRTLSQSEERLKRSQEIAHLGSWELDIGKNELTWSAEVYRIFGLRPHQFEATYEAFLTSVHPDDRQKVDEAYLGSLRDNRDTYAVEHRVVRPDGEIRFVHEKCEHQRDTAGRITRSMGMVHDITEIHRAQEALRRSNQELEQFAYVASHDLQEPLRAVVGFLQLLESRYGDQIDAKGRNYIERSVRAGHRMQTLIRDLLTLSRVNTRGATFASADLNQILKNALDNLHSIIQERELDITSAHLPSLSVDASQIQSLFQNLILNAVKYNESAKPVIDIKCREHERIYQFSVKDNGIGIAPEFHQRIFMVFQRLHTDREYPGTGLGLALCKKIVERHGGRIWVESRPKDGSTFQFTLPQQR